MARRRAVGWWLAGTASAGLLAISATLLLSAGTTVAVPRRASRQPTGRRVDVRSPSAMAMAKLGRSALVKRNPVDGIDNSAHVHVVQPVLGGSFGLALDEMGADPSAWEDAVAAEEEAAASEGSVADKEEMLLLDEAEASAPLEDLDPLPPSPASAADGDTSPPPPSRTVSAETGAPSLSSAGASVPEAAVVSSVTEADVPGVAAPVTSSTAESVMELPHTDEVITPGAVSTATKPGALATEATSIAVAAESVPEDVAASATLEAAAVVVAANAAAANAAAARPVPATAAQVSPPKAAVTMPVAAAAVPVVPVTVGPSEAVASTAMVETAAGMTAPKAMATATETTTALPVAPEAMPEAPATAPVDAAVPDGDASESAAELSSVSAAEVFLDAEAAPSPAKAIEARLGHLAASSPEAFDTSAPEEVDVAGTPNSRATASHSRSVIPAAAAHPPVAMAVMTPLPHAVINDDISADSSSTVRLRELLDARLAGNSKESVASKLRLLHRISQEREAQAKADHELLPPVEDVIAPDAGTVVDARRRPPIHGRLPEREDTTALTAVAAMLTADDALGAAKNATDTARAGEHASAVSVKRARAVPAATVGVKSSPPAQESIPAMVKKAIPLSPDAAGDILVMNEEATLAATSTPPGAAGPATDPARAVAAATYSPSPSPARGAPLAAPAADPAGAVTASSSVDEVAVSATSTEAAASGAATSTHSEKPGGVATMMTTPSPTMTVTLSSQSDRPDATTTGPVRASEEAGIMVAAAAAAALDAFDRVGPLPSPVVTPVDPSTQVDSATTAVTQEPVPAMMVGQEGPPDAAVAVANASLPADESFPVNASSTADGTRPLTPAASQDQQLPESARSYTQMASRVAAAAIEAVMREATASAWASAAASPGASATATPSSLTPPPRRDGRAESAAVAPSPSGKVRTAPSRRPPSTPTTMKQTQSMRGGKRHDHYPVFRSPLPTPPSAATAGGRPVVPPDGAAATPASMPTSTGSRGVYLFAGDGSVWYSFAGRLARVGGDMAGGTAATDTALVEESMMAAEGANPKGAVPEGSLWRPEVTALLLKRMMSPGGVLARELPATAVPDPPTLAALPSGLGQRSAPSLSSSPLPDLPTPVRRHRPATSAAPAVPAVDADTSSAPNRAAIPWLVRAAEPATFAVAASGTSSPPPHPPSEGGSNFGSVARLGGTCHYNQTSCSCAPWVSSVPSPAHPPRCIRFVSPGATASALSWCATEPCEGTASRFVCDCMGSATCGLERKVVDGWRRVRGGEGEEEEAQASAKGDQFHCELRERLITVVTCVERCG
ncbi:hypothetical protein MMPV_001430 [Pyropia vietnamensis]